MLDELRRHNVHRVALGYLAVPLDPEYPMSLQAMIDALPDNRG